MNIATAGLFTGSFPTALPRVVAEYLALFNGTDSDGPYAIGRGTWVGGVWAPYASNPVISKGTGGTWDDDHVKDPWLIGMPDGSLVCYYSGHDGSKYQIGRATSTDGGLTWTKYASNPVLTVGSGGAFDDAGILFPTVLYDPDAGSRAWKMWYGADAGSGVLTVGYAYSSDGLSWTKHGKVIDVGAGATWNDSGVLPGAVIRHGSTYYLFAGGRQNTTTNFWQGGLWTFTDPEGTYTAASNPVLASRFAETGVFQSLTSNTGAGSSTVLVASTAAFHDNEPVILADGSSESHVTHIANIDSGTQVTIADPAPSAFTTADGAVFRPMNGISVLPRTVRRLHDGTWEIFLSVFQPIEDLTPGGSKLREASMRATSPDADGPWAYDYDTGLLFPLGDGWDTFSAENPSVIPA